MTKSPSLQFYAAMKLFHIDIDNQLQSSRHLCKLTATWHMCLTSSQHISYKQVPCKIVLCIFS